MAEPHHVNLRVEIDRETDGRWIADVVDLPGTQVYGTSREQALAAVKVLALRVLADRLESGELRAEDLADVHFVPDAA